MQPPIAELIAIKTSPACIRYRLVCEARVEHRAVPVSGDQTAQRRQCCNKRTAGAGQNTGDLICLYRTALALPRRLLAQVHVEHWALRV